MEVSQRRQFLVQTVGVGLVLSACSSGHRQATSPTGMGKDEEEDISPPEDLMREHGILNRILLVYDESARRLEQRQPLPVERLTQSARLIKTFIEQYHEKLEEDYLFPRFEKAGKLVDLVTTLRRQHEAGRKLTESILRLCTAEVAREDDERSQLIGALRSFVRMYRPHEAREDTVLFPALRSVFGKNEFEELGERFEEKEHALFGEHGFESIVQQLGSIEAGLGIFDLDQFTP